MCVSVCARVCTDLPQAQLETTEQEIHEMIKLRIRKMEEIRQSVNKLEVDQTHHHLKNCQSKEAAVTLETCTQTIVGSLDHFWHSGFYIKTTVGLLGFGKNVV